MDYGDGRSTMGHHEPVCVHPAVLALPAVRAVTQQGKLPSS